MAKSKKLLSVFHVDDDGYDRIATMTVALVTQVVDAVLAVPLNGEDHCGVAIGCGRDNIFLPGGLFLERVDEPAGLQARYGESFDHFFHLACLGIALHRRDKRRAAHGRVALHDAVDAILGRGHHANERPQHCEQISSWHNLIHLKVVLILFVDQLARHQALLALRHQ